MPKGFYKRTAEHRQLISNGVKNHLPSTAFKVGVDSYPESKFKKGRTPWNKGTVGVSGGGRPKKIDNQK